MKPRKRQQQVVGFVKGYTEARGYPPTVREIQRATGVASTGTVHRDLDQLQERGLIARDRRIPRSVRVVEG